MEMWNCDEVDKTVSAMCGVGISVIKRLVPARLSEICPHPMPVTSILLSEFLFVVITQKIIEVKPSMQPV